MTMNNIFQPDFWIQQWKNDKNNDTFTVHKGFSSPEYWDNAAATYDMNQAEIKSRRIEKVIATLKNCGLLYEGVAVLDIGCGTGMLSIELARNGAQVTALDFSENMLGRLKNDIPEDLRPNIQILHEDWHQIDISEKGWEKKFDLVIAFMSPGVSKPDAFFKMMGCARKGCAMKGWAAKRAHPVMSDLWLKIMGTPLEDKPQSIYYKINLLFSLNYYPEISFSTLNWEQRATIDEECEKQISFFQKVSTKSKGELEKIIRPYLEQAAENNLIVRKHKGLTATAIWRMDIGTPDDNNGDH